MFIDLFSYLKKEHGRIVPAIVCRDGFRMSVQASSGHYCSPRVDVSPGGWTAYEVGFPNRREALLKEYAEDKRALTKTVYGWVPVHVIEKVIAKHGGFASLKA
jgi:hypothetical protein